MNFVSRAPLVIGLVAAAACFAVATGTRAELTADQKKNVAEIAGLVREAAMLDQSGDFEASGQRLESAIAAIETLIGEGGAEAYDAVSPEFSRLINTHALLELEGVTVRPFEQPQRPGAATMPEPAEGASAQARPEVRSGPRSRPGRTAPVPQRDDAGPSFVRQVAPILVQHCGRCHVSAAQGKFSMATFALLAQGSPAGRVVIAGDLSSPLIEMIQSGDMPHGDGSVPAAQFQTLKDWVLAGAKYDGDSPTVPLASMVSNAPPPAAPASTAQPPSPAQPPAGPSVRPPTGNETVSFAKDIAPLLLDHCKGCHIDAMQTRGGLRMDSFATLMRGGDSGEAVLPNRAAASLLIRKLKGEEGARMPAGGRPPLSDDAIGLISTWIEEGAAFDGDTPEQPLSIVASLAWAKSASEQELSERRAELARKNLQLLGSPTNQRVEETSDSFFVIGDVTDSTAKVVSAAAAKALTKIKPFADPAAIRGRVTLFVFPKRYDYSEFAKMVEQRSVPAEWQSHWKQDGVDAYIALFASPGDSASAIEARLIGPLSSLAVSMRGSEVPRWFAEGVGRAAAAKLAARELPSIQQWSAALPAAVMAMKDGKQFVESGLPPEQTDLIGYGIVSMMLGRNQRRQYDALLKELGKAESFDAAFTAAFGGPPAAYVDRWKPYALSGIDGRRR